MLNAIPGIGWLINIILMISLAVPFWLFWTVFGMGEKFFYFVPAVYHNPRFWECVGVFTIMPILKTMLLPKIFNFTTSSSSTTEKSKS